MFYRFILIFFVLFFSNPALALNVWYFTAVGTTQWTCPITGYYEVWAQGGGAGGGGGSDNGGGGDGGGEGQFIPYIIYFTSGVQYTIVIGDGGMGGLGTTSTGQWGGMSTSGSATTVWGLAAGGGPQAHGGAPNDINSAGHPGIGNSAGAGADGGSLGGDASGVAAGGGGGGGTGGGGSGPGKNGGKGMHGWARIMGPLS